MTVSLAMQCNI